MQQFNENPSDYFTSNIFGGQQSFYQPIPLPQQKYAQNQFVQPPFGGLKQTKDYSAPSKLAGFPGASPGNELVNLHDYLPNSSEIRMYDFLANPDILQEDPHRLEDIFSHKIDLGTQKSPVKDEGAILEIFQPFTSDFGESLMKNPGSEKPKKSLYENLFVHPEEHDQV